MSEPTQAASILETLLRLTVEEGLPWEPVGSCGFCSEPPGWRVNVLPDMIDVTDAGTGEPVCGAILEPDDPQKPALDGLLCAIKSRAENP